MDFAETSPPPRQSKKLQRESTIARLLAIARARFSELGYAQVSGEDLVREAGLTRGALYHHFGNKEGLFRAVLEEVQQDVAAQVLAAANAEHSAEEQLFAGCRAYLRAAQKPDVQRILLVEAPAVVGWAVWRESDSRHSMRLLREGLEALAAHGMLGSGNVEALTHMLSGAMNELALWVAQSGKPSLSLKRAEQTLMAMLHPLVAKPAPAIPSPPASAAEDGEPPIGSRA